MTQPYFKLVFGDFSETPSLEIDSNGCDEFACELALRLQIGFQLVHVFRVVFEFDVFADDLSVEGAVVCHDLVRLKGEEELFEGPPGAFLVCHLRVTGFAHDAESFSGTKKPLNEPIP